MIEVRVDELHAVARTVDGSMRLTLVGAADTSAEVALNELLGRLHGELQKPGGRGVVVDMHGLTAMNSSCFKSFITWIVAVRRLPEDQRYRIRFRPNAAMDWQMRSLQAILHFGGDLVSIEN